MKFEHLYGNCESKTIKNANETYQKLKKSMTKKKRRKMLKMKVKNIVHFKDKVRSILIILTLS